MLPFIIDSNKVVTFGVEWMVLAAWDLWVARMVGWLWPYGWMLGCWVCWLPLHRLILVPYVLTLNFTVTIVQIVFNIERRTPRSV